VTWSFDVKIPRALDDIARSLDPQSWAKASKLFYDSYLVDTPSSCCPHTDTSDCSFKSQPVSKDPQPGTSHSPGQAYDYTAFFEYFCAGNSCPLCQGQPCLSAFKTLRCVKTHYNRCVPVPSLATFASNYDVSYQLARFLSGQVNGADTGEIRTDSGTLSVRPACAAEKQNLPGNVWSVVHVDKTLVFRSGAMTAGVGKILKSLEKELGDRIVEQACHNIPRKWWFPW